MRPSFTLGIEEEYQTIDPGTRDLRSHIDMEIIAKGKTLLREAVKPEMHQSVIEVGTGVCKNIKEAKRQIFELRREICQLARDNGLRHRRSPQTARRPQRASLGPLPRCQPP